MPSLIESLTQAQQHAMSIRPKIGGIPVLAEVLRRAGVRTNRWTLPACQSLYLMDGGSVVQQGTPLLAGTAEAPTFDREALIVALRTDQEGRGTFPEFLKAAWKAGVVAYEVDFTKRQVT